MEIERKFIPKKLPDDLQIRKSISITQAYLCTDPVVRIRKEGDTFTLTYKGRGLFSREEHNLPLTEQAFYHLLKKCDGTVIQKTRYRAPVKHCPNLIEELDVFDGAFKGLVVLEVEFPSVEIAEHFMPPAWYGEEVTLNPAYQNASLSNGKDPRNTEKEGL